MRALGKQRIRTCAAVVALLCWVGPAGCSDDDDGPTYTPTATVPTITDWECPTDWDAVPGFTDEAGAEDVPEGMTQFMRCEPPAAWDGPSGPVQLQSWTCPTGWQTVTDATLIDEGGNPFTYCEPPRVARLFVPGGADDGSDYLSPIPEGASAADYQQCDPTQGMMPELWGTGCVRIGDECPTGTFPTIPTSVTGNRIYVLASATAGNGTDASPFATIGEAVTAATAGDVIVVGAGTYDERIQVTKALTLWGACVEQVHLTTTTGTDEQSVVSVEAPLTLKNVQISGTSMGVHQVNTGSADALDMTGVYVHHASRRAVLIQEGHAAIRDSLVFGTRPAVDDNYARGIQSGWDFSGPPRGLSIERVVVEHVTTAVIVFGDGADLNATDVLARNARAESDRSYGPCFAAYYSGVLNATRVQAELCEGITVAVQTGSQVTFEDALIANTRPATQGNMEGVGRGLEAGGASVTTLRRTLIRDIVYQGLAAFVADTEVHLEDVVVRRIHPVNNDGGTSLAAYQGGSLFVTRVVVGEGAEDAVMVEESSHLSGEDLVVRNQILNPENTGTGAGIRLRGDATASLQRVLVDRNAGRGIELKDGGNTLELNDAVIRDTQPRSDGDRGVGLEVFEGGDVTLRGVVVQRSHTGGVILWDSRLEATDLVIRDTRARASDHELGAGLVGVAGSTIRVQRGTIEGNHFAGVGSEGEEGTQPGMATELSLTDVLIQDTHEPASGNLGGGLHVLNGHTAELLNVVIRRSHTYGLTASRDAQLLVANLVITDTAPTADTTAPGTAGWGLSVGAGAVLNAQDVLVEGSYDSGAVFSDAGPSTLTNVIIRDTALAECAGYEPSDPGYCVEDGEVPTSRGVALQGESEVTLSRFELADNGALGAQILVGETSDGTPFDAGGVLHLSSGGVLDADVGVCLQSLPDYDESTLDVEVYWGTGMSIEHDDTYAAPK